MKKIISMVLVIFTIFSFSVSAMAKSNCERKYSKCISKNFEDYYNVKIDDIYYDISICTSSFYNLDNYLKYKDTNGKTYFAKVETVDSVKKGKVLKYPDEINFKGKKLKINYIGFSCEEEYCSGHSYSYKEIYIPKYATVVNYSTLKLKNIRKIYLSDKVKIVAGLNDYSKLKVIISKNNDNFKMLNGAIYSKNNKDLYCLVNSKKVYKVRKQTKNINISFNNTVEKLILPNSMTNIDGNDSSIDYCKKIKFIKFGKNTKKISSLINNCPKLEKINFGNKLEVLGDFSIQYCPRLKEITLPKTLKRIKKLALSDCENLKKVVLNNENNSPKLDKQAFENTADGISFYVKNQKVANSLLKQFKANKSGVKNAKIYVGNTLVYSDIN